jgi:hypothetical protein
MDPTGQHWPVWTSARAYLGEPASRFPARIVRRIATLERNSPRLVKTADGAGVDITYLGIAEVFAEHRAYPGQHTDWIIGPAGSSDTVIPLAEKKQLQKLLYAGIDFPLVYVAHEIPKGQIAMPDEIENTGDPRPVTLDQQTAAQAIGPVPPPAGTSALAERLARHSQRLLDVLGTAVSAAGAIAATPFALAGSALAGLDPIVFGVIPAGAPIPGQPAAWYALAQWAWPGTADSAASDRGQTAQTHSRRQPG